MNNEIKFDFKNITKDDVAKLAAPHLNYVTFDYTNSDGVESERNLRVLVLNIIINQIVTHIVIFI